MFYRYEHYMSISHMALIVAMEHGNWSRKKTMNSNQVYLA